MLALECGWYAQQCYIAEDWFFLSQQVAIATHFWVRGWTLCLSPHLSAGALPGLDLSLVLCVWSQSLCVLVFISLLVPERYTFSESFTTSLLAIFPCLLCRFLSLEGRGLIKAEFRAECSKVFLTLYTVLLWILVLITVDCKKQLLWWGLSDAWIYEDSNYKRKKS